MKSVFLAVAVGIIGMIGGIILVIFGDVNSNAAMTQTGGYMITFILGAVFGPGLPTTIKAVKAARQWLKGR